MVTSLRKSLKLYERRFWLPNNKIGVLLHPATVASDSLQGSPTKKEKKPGGDCYRERQHPPDII